MFIQVVGRLHIELMRISGAVPERLSCGDDSSENSSESSCYEVMDTNGEIVHMAKRLTCRVFANELPFHISTFVLTPVSRLERSLISSSMLFVFICYRYESGRLQVCHLTCPTSSSVSTPSGSMVSPLWLLPWSAQTDLLLGAQTPSLLYNLITAR